MPNEIIGTFKRLKCVFVAKIQTIQIPKKSNVRRLHLNEAPRIVGNSPNFLRIFFLCNLQILNTVKKFHK